MHLVELLVLTFLLRVAWGQSYFHVRTLIMMATQTAMSLLFFGGALYNVVTVNVSLDELSGELNLEDGKTVAGIVVVDCDKISQRISRTRIRMAVCNVEFSRVTLTLGAVLGILFAVLPFAIQELELK